jgi:endonuclease/exonuclease/phosphatase family metal-dependent hydrolase
MDSYNQTITLGNPKAFPKDTFSVMTYNIGYLSGMSNNQAVPSDDSLYSANLESAIQFIEMVNADFLAFQEIDFGASRSFKIDQLETIGEQTGYAYGAYSVNWDKQYVPFPYWPPSVHFGKMLSGQGVVSTYPFVHNKRIVLQKPEEEPFYYNAFYLDRLLQITQVDVGRPLIIMNVHLEAFHRNTREEQAKFVSTKVKEYMVNYPVILAGDFNSRPPFASSPGVSEQTIQLFMEIPGLKMAIPDSIYRANEPDYFTFSSGRPVEKIDYIFYTSDKINPVRATVPSQAGQISDHLPVYFEFTFKNR